MYCRTAGDVSISGLFTTYFLVLMIQSLAGLYIIDRLRLVP
jgi:hypothetical protein